MSESLYGTNSNTANPTEISATLVQSFRNVQEENLLHIQLSNSTALSSVITPISTTTKVPTPVTIKNMITKEVNDTHLNVKKILYCDEKEVLKSNDQESVSQMNFQKQPDLQIDDDDRLIIDISDDENFPRTKRKKKEKSISSLNKDKVANNSTFTEDFPTPVMYSLNATAIDSNYIKIDILTPSSLYSNSSTTETSKSLASSKYTSISLHDEITIISHEIDKHMNKKTNEILCLIKEYIESSISKSEFYYKMSEIGNISCTDLSVISKKLVKKHKYEPNPNQRDFMRVKNFHFPTSSNDLVSYFARLVPTMNKEKFVQMIKFYELIINEMLKQNKTKILQYLIDFMIKRKNAQLDMLDYNYETCSSPHFKKASATLSTIEMPDSTQNSKNDRKISALCDTSYNFLIRSDPIYLTAGSTFMTNHRDVIKCRSTPLIQSDNFERKPFDNNILKGRRIVRRMTNSGKEEDQSRKDTKLLKPSNERKYVLMTNKSSIGDTLNKAQSVDQTAPQSAKMKCNSSILVESDSDSSSPVSYKIIKPTGALQNISKEKEANHQKITADVNSGDLLKNSSIKEQLSLSEIQTLNLNGTEIIPTSILHKRITTRRKTIDVDQTPTPKISMEVRKIFLRNRLNKSPSLLSTTKTAYDYIHSSQMPLHKQSVSKILKRRQSCHEHIFIPSKTSTANNVGRNFLEFLNKEYEIKKREEGSRKMHSLQFDEEKKIQDNQTKYNNSRDSTNPIYAQQKRVRFINDDATNLQHLNQSVGYTNITTARINQNKNDNTLLQTIENPLMQPVSKTYQSLIDYHQYQLYCERELKERGFADRVESLKNCELSYKLTQNRPLELVSSIPPESYLRNPDMSLLNGYSNTKSLKNIDKSTRLNQRTPLMIDDEAATLVAYHQLQSLHKDPSIISAQQYSEHLKQLHQIKQFKNSIYKSTQMYNADEENQVEEERETFYHNTQPEIVHNFTGKSSSQVQNDMEKQSLQRKLKLKVKSSKYIEPGQFSNPYYKTPYSTYYTDPYINRTHKKTQIPAIYQSQETVSDCVPQNYLPDFYNIKNDSNISPPRYNLMVTEQQHQRLLNHNQPTRPIPRSAVPVYNDGKTNRISSDHNMFPHNSVQSYQQSEFYQPFFHP